MNPERLAQRPENYDERVDHYVSLIKGGIQNRDAGSYMIALGQFANYLKQPDDGDFGDSVIGKFFGPEWDSGVIKDFIIDVLAKAGGGIAADYPEGDKLQ